jgi:catechol 2,3-dioxygenase-like lactoylglutathione lyase family enzyme
MDFHREPVPFVISYFTCDLAANRRFYGEFLGLSLRSEPGLEDVFFLAGTEPVRLERAALGITERRDEEEGPNTAARFRDPDGRMVVVQLFDPAHRFHH